MSKRNLSLQRSNTYGKVQTSIEVESSASFLSPLEKYPFAGASRHGTTSS